MDSTSGTLKGTLKGTLSVGTINIKNLDEDEIEELADTVDKENIDVICIQDANKIIKEVLFRSFKSRKYQYTRFDQAGSNMARQSHEFIFSKIPIIESSFSRFNSSPQNRGVCAYLVKACYDTQNPVPVWICTSQFEEGGEGARMRKTQIIELKSMMKLCLQSLDTSSIIFAGDTCIPQWQNTALGPPEGWKDSWKMRGTSKTEQTRDSIDRMDQIWFTGENIEISQFYLTYDKKCAVSIFNV